MFDYQFLIFDYFDLFIIINVITFCENIVSINLQATGSFIDNYD